MNAAELRKKKPEELKSDLENLLREQLQLRMQRGSGQMPNPHMFKKIRRNIARIKTVINEETGAKS